MNVKSKTMCTGINFHKCCLFGGVLGSDFVTILSYCYFPLTSCCSEQEQSPVKCHGASTEQLLLFSSLFSRRQFFAHAARLFQLK